VIGRFGVLSLIVQAMAPVEGQVTDATRAGRGCVAYERFGTF
jgi:hypothetical protein